MRKYYKNTSTGTMYRSQLGTTRLEIKASYRHSTWANSLRYTNNERDMINLTEIAHPNSRIFATMALTLALSTLAYLMAGAF